MTALIPGPYGPVPGAAMRAAWKAGRRALGPPLTWGVTAMMYFGNHGMGGWAWFGMSASVIVFWALVIGVGVLAYRALSRPTEHTHQTAHTAGTATAEQLLAERFARGEIDQSEYGDRLATLRSADRFAQR